LLSPEQTAFVASWPRFLEYDYPCGRVFFVHGSPTDYQNGYVYPDSDLTEFDGAYDFVFMGHTHRAFVREHGARIFVNVGSCGLPRDDGRYASAALFDPYTGRTTLVRLELSFFDAVSFFARLDVHHSVAELFNRRQADISGEIIESN
jgi:diadenosine tetraphosphatase ApaH/serine/threonine PP2A family protein phosphatase